jgi:hypothetical protein
MTKCYNKNIEPFKTIFKRYSKDKAYYLSNLMETNTYKKDWTDELVLEDDVLYAISKDNKRWNLDEEAGKERVDEFTIPEEELITSEEYNDAPIQRGIQDLTLSQRLFDGKNSSTAVELLTKIGNSSHPMNKIAKKLLERLPANIEIKLVNNVEYAGQFNPVSNDIKINEFARFKEKGSEPTIVHEVLHYLTNAELRRGGNVVSEFQKLYDYTKSNQKLKEILQDNYPMTDLDEFIVGIFTNSRFIDAMKEIPAMNDKSYNNLWEEIWGYILKIFNITEPSLYEQAFALGTQIVEDNYQYNQSYESYDEMPYDVSFFNEEYKTEKRFEKELSGLSVLLGISDKLSNLGQVRFDIDYETEDGYYTNKFKSLGLFDLEIEYLFNWINKLEIKQSNSINGVLAKIQLAELNGGVLKDISIASNIIDEKLNDKLEKWANQFGIEVRSIEEFRRRTGKNALGVADTLNKIIYYNKEQATETTFAEEIGHFYIEMMGSRNPLFQTLQDKITEWSEYNTLFEQYKDIYKKEDGSPDYFKIKKEIMGKAISQRIVGKSKAETSEFWKYVDDVIQYIKTLFKDIERFNLELIVDEIASDILTNKNKYLGFGSFTGDQIPANFELKTFENTIKSNPKLLTIVEKASKLGGVLTGSLAYRKQGTVYRKTTESIHDLDFKIPFSAHNKIGIEQFIDNARKELGLSRAIRPSDNEYMAWYQDNKYNSVGYVGGTRVLDWKKEGYYNEGDILWLDKNGNQLNEPRLLETGELAFDGISIDFFFEPEGYEIQTDYDNYAYWADAFQEKMKMGRDKDAFDYRTFIPNKGFREGTIKEEFLYYDKEKTSNASIAEDTSLKDELDAFHKNYEIRRVDISTAPTDIQKKLKRLDNDGDNKIDRYVNKSTGEIIWARVSDAQTYIYNKYKSIEEIQQEENTEKNVIARDTGTVLHAYMQNRIVSLSKKYKNITTDRNDELVYEGKDRDEVFKLVNNADLQKLDTTLERILQRISDNGGGKLYTEQLIIDELLGGSMDILVLHNDNTFSIYDYKFIESSYYDTKLEKEVYYNKITGNKLQSYNSQIAKYVDLIKKYGLTPKETLIIPVSRRQEFSNNTIGRKVKSIGTVVDSDNLEFVPVAYMLPKDERLQGLVASLYDEVRKLEKDYSDEGKIRKEELYKSIQGIVVNTDLSYLLSASNSLANLLEKDIVDIKDFDTLNKYKELLEIYSSLGIELESFIDDKLVSDYRKLRNRLALLEIQINEKEFELLQTGALKEGINIKQDNLKQLSWYESMTSTLSDIVNPVFRYFSKLLESANAKIYKDVMEVNNDLTKFKELTKEDYEFIIDKEKGNIKDEISGTFYTELADARNTGDFDWFRKNIVFNKEKYDRDYNRKKDSLMSLGYGETFVNDKLEVFEKLYNVEKYPEAYFTSNLAYKYHKWDDLDFKDKFKSDFIKELETKGGLIKEFYEYYTDKIKEYRKTLYDSGIDINKNFIPNIHQGLVESGDWYKWAYDTKGVSRRFMSDTLEIKELGDEMYGEQNKIPIFFTTKIEDKSYDLSKSLLLFTKTVKNYEYKTQMESITQSLQHLIEKQKVIKTNKWGKVVKEYGIPVTDYSKRNIETFDRFVKMNVYGQNYQDKDFTFTLDRNGIPKLLQGYIFAKDEKGNYIEDNKTISTVKGIGFLQRFMSFKDLGLNPISAAVNSLSNRFNAYMIGQEGQYFKSSQFKDSTNLLSKNDKKFWAITQWLDINKSIEYKANQLSTFSWNNDKFINNAMLLTSEPEEALRRSISVAFLKNHTLSNGKISKLKDGEISLYDSIEAKETEDGVELVIGDKPISEAIDSEIYYNYRNKTLKLLSKITGSVNEEDKSLYRTYLLGQIVMQYRSWIPRVVESKWGNFRYDHLMEDYDVGRYRVFLDNFTEHTFWKLKTLTKSLLQGVSMGIYRGGKLKDLEGLKKSVFMHLYNKAKLENPKLTQEEFLKLVIAKQRGLIAESRILLAAWVMYWGIWGLFKGDTEDNDSWLFKQQQRINKKLLSELMFNYDIVSSVPELIKTPFPMYRLTQDFFKIATNSGDELRDVTFGENSSQDKSPFAYYSMQMIPVANILYKLTLDLPSDDSSYFNIKKGDTGIQLGR